MRDHSKTYHMQCTITTCATELGWLRVPPFYELAQVSSQAMCFEHVQNRMTLKRDLTYERFADKGMIS